MCAGRRLKVLWGKSQGGVVSSTGGRSQSLAPVPGLPEGIIKMSLAFYKYLIVTIIRSCETHLHYSYTNIRQCILYM